MAFLLDKRLCLKDIAATASLVQWLGEICSTTCAGHTPEGAAAYV